MPSKIPDSPDQPIYSLHITSRWLFLFILFSGLVVRCNKSQKQIGRGTHLGIYMYVCLCVCASVCMCMCECELTLSAASGSLCNSY